MANEGSQKGKKDNLVSSITSREKCRMLKDTIYQLYVNEGRSKVYISKLLQVNRKVLSEEIESFGFVQKHQFRDVKPSTKKYINRNKDKILKWLNEDELSLSEMARQLNIERRALVRTIIKHDKDLYKAYTNQKQRIEDKRNQPKPEGRLKYTYEEIEGEEWRPVLGYPRYEVSNKGRVRATNGRGTYLIKPSKNVRSGYLYVNLQTSKTRRMLSLGRVVAFAFVDGHSETNNTVNHKDRNVENNCADNLEWVSQSENNRHSYKTDKTKREIKNRHIFDKIVLDNKYTFTTMTEYAKFVGISFTQASRRLDNPKKWNIELVTTK